MLVTYVYVQKLYVLRICYVPKNCFTAKWPELSFKLGETSFTLPTTLSGNLIKQDWQRSYLLLGWAVSLHSPTHVLSNEQISYDHWRAKKPGKAEFLISLGGKKTLSRGQHFQHFVRRVLLSAAPLPSSITTSRRTTRALPKVASCLKCRQALGWPSRSSRWYRSLLLGTVLRFLSCFTGISGCITTTHRIKEVSWTYKTQTSC